MTDVKQLITEHLDIWLTAETEKKSGRGRSSGSKDTIYGVQKLRELILDLAISGKIVAQSSLSAEILIKDILSTRNNKISNEELKTKASDSIEEKDKNYIVTPNNWAWIRLGNVARFIDYRGKTPKKIESGIPLITAKNVRFGFIDEEPREFISAEDYKEWMTRGFPNKGDLLFTTEAPLGNIAEISLDYQFALAQRVICFQLHEPKLSQFLRLLIMSQKFQNKLEDEATGMTATGIKASKLKEIAIPLPPLEEQQHIVEKVDELMQLCDQLEQQQTLSSDAHATLVDTLLKALTESSDADAFQGNWQRIVANFDLLFTTEYSIEQLKQTILQLAVMGKLVKQDPTDEPASELLKKIAGEKAKLIKEGKIKKFKPLPEIGEDEQPFELLSGWEWVRLEDLSDPIRGITYGIVKMGDEPEHEGINAFRCSDIKWRHIDDRFVRKVTNDVSQQYSRTILQGGEILINIRGTLGGVAIVDEKYKGFNIAREIGLIPLINPSLNNFVLNVLSSSYFNNMIEENLRGIAYKGLNLNILSNFIIPLPPLNEQSCIVEKVNQLFSMIEQLQVLQSKLQKIKLHLADALVANAVEGV
ncbi:hypothetical protein HLH10_08280 [Acinetobacter sp. ANC 4277]|uniref:restriction endonuclease subunit S n=1 Tax=Acinetobacter terrae TaxID=2731247 RepID=UPI00149089D0|nr:restriction endonuclease subunit S [Acinetobacter terrae]NNG76321.1 hypothetical protein [Acinetobacter terrae]